MCKRAAQQQCQGADTWALGSSPANSPFSSLVKLWFGWKLNAEHRFLSRSGLPLSPLPNTWSFAQSVQGAILLSPQATSYYLKCYTALSSWVWNKPRGIYQNKKRIHLYHTREPAKLLHMSESTNSVNSDHSLQFHFRKRGVTQSWTPARHCNKTNAATEAPEWELHPCHPHRADSNRCMKNWSQGRGVTPEHSSIWEV